jgi:U4/U6.U5 tri-snRNP-associated protein 1
VTDFQEGLDTILVLKDSQIIGDDEEGDELLNVNMVEHKKAQENVENRKKKPGYTAYEDDEFSINNPGQKKDILSQYDEEIMGGTNKKSSGFTLSRSGVIVAPKQDKRSVSEKLKEKTVTLDFEKNKEITDYYTQEELSVKIKKPKKKNKQKNNRSSRKNLDAEEDAEEKLNFTAPMEIDFSQSNKNKTLEDSNFVDDDDLQAAISRARRIAAQKSTRPEEAVQGISSVLK